MSCVDGELLAAAFSFGQQGAVLGRCPWLAALWPCVVCVRRRCDALDPGREGIGFPSSAAWTCWLACGRGLRPGLSWW
jgi:hypothetical protein